MKGLAAILALALGASPALAGENVFRAVAEQVDLTAKAAGNAGASPFEVRDQGARLQSLVENARGPVMVGHPWADVSDLPAAAPSAQQLVNAAARSVQLDRDQHVPDIDLAAAIQGIRDLNDQGRIRLASMDRSSLGRYDYREGTPTESGRISVSDLAPTLTGFLGESLVALAVLGHEIGHALDARLHEGHEHAGKDMNRVIREESLAYATGAQLIRASFDTEEHLLEALGSRERAIDSYLYRHPGSPTGLAAKALLMTIHDTVVSVDSLGRPDWDRLAKIVQRNYKSDGSPVGS